MDPVHRLDAAWREMLPLLEEDIFHAKLSVKRVTLTAPPTICALEIELPLQKQNAPFARKEEDQHNVVRPVHRGFHRACHRVVPRRVPASRTAAMDRRRRRSAYWTGDPDRSHDNATARPLELTGANRAHQ